MSNMCYKIAKAKKPSVWQRRKKMREACKFYTSFNIFTENGESVVVHTTNPMPLYEARSIYTKAAKIIGIE